jgi:MFS family permease
MAGQVAGLLGNHLYLIALPWLVLQLTGDVIAMGTTILLSGVPRIALMLMGGAVSDRLSSRTVMLGANIARASLLAWLAWLALAGQVELWMLYGASFAYGLIEAFFAPARSAILPQVVRQDRLQTANVVASSLEQGCGLVGPVAAGLAIAWANGALAGTGAGTSGLYGVGAALSLAVLTTLISVAMLWRVAPRRTQAAAKQARPRQDVISSVKEALVFVWQHGTLRNCILMVVAINVLTAGPIGIGLPALAGTRLAGGAAALGVLTSALGAGALLGAMLAGLSPQPQSRQIGQVFVMTISVCIAGLFSLACTASTLVAVLATLAVGAAISYVNVTTVTWMQSHTPGPLMGRIMSLAALK